MVGYHRKFINRFADAARPLTRLTRRGMKFQILKELPNQGANAQISRAIKEIGIIHRFL